MRISMCISGGNVLVSWCIKRMSTMPRGRAHCASYQARVYRFVAYMEPIFRVARVTNATYNLYMVNLVLVGF